MAIIMGWSKCSVEIGATGADDAMATSLTDVGKIKDKSAVLEPTQGEVLEGKATGGELVAREETEGGVALTIRVIEPTNALFESLGLGDVATDDIDVKTHVVSGDKSVVVTPKNVGAIGIKAAKTQVSFRPGWSDAEGNYVDIVFTFIKTAAGKWYTRFKKPAPQA